MILVDDRTGSRDLVPLLERLGHRTAPLQLNAGDAAFEGKGKAGAAVSVGVERKRLDTSDLMASLMSGRLAAGQMPKIATDYDYAWLVVEGQWRTNKQGELEVLKRGRYVTHGGLDAATMQKRVLTLELCGGLHVRYTEDAVATAHFISTLYHWFTDKALDEHQSHIAVQTPMSTVPLSKFRQAVCMWPGIGVRTSLAVERAFSGDLIRAATSGVETWANVQTIDRQGKARRFGQANARVLVDFLHGRTV